MSTAAAANGLIPMLSLLTVPTIRLIATSPDPSPSPPPPLSPPPTMPPPLPMMPPPRTPPPALELIPGSAQSAEQVQRAWDDDTAANAALDATATAISAAQLLQTACTSNAVTNANVSCAHDPTTPLTLGDTRIVFSDALIHGNVSAVLLEPPEASAPPIDAASLVSSVVSVSSDAPMAPLPSVGSSMILVTIPVVHTPPSTNLSCVAARDADTHGNATCIAGCCINGGCVCRFGYTGDFCQYELRCVHLRPGDPSWQADDACIAREHRGDMAQLSLVCSCRQLGLIAVMSFRVTPPTNIGGFASWDRVAPNFASTALRAAIPALFFVLVLLLIAACADRGSVYVDASLPSLPRALVPTASFAWRDELRANIITHTCVLRCFFVWRGFTPYTHAQGCVTHVSNAGFAAPRAAAAHAFAFDLSYTLESWYSLIISPSVPSSSASSLGSAPRCARTGPPSSPRCCAIWVGSSFGFSGSSSSGPTFQTRCALPTPSLLHLP